MSELKLRPTKREADASRRHFTRRGGPACHRQALTVNDRVCGFIFWFPVECSAKRRRKQPDERPDKVQKRSRISTSYTKTDRSLYEVRRTVSVQVFSARAGATAREIGPKPWKLRYNRAQ